MRANSYAVDTAEEGEDGLFKAGCTDCDALVFDVMLPDTPDAPLLEFLRRTMGAVYA